MGAITAMIDDGFVINERFQIKRVLGQGGFAMVFEGVDLNLDRTVAIKVLHGALTGSSESRQRDVIDRFEREARLAASVEHPSIVNIYDVGEIDELGEPFIVMEYLKGRSFADQLDEFGAMEAKKIIPLYKDLLLGMGFAHEAGIVHKDLKPENIFFRHPDTIRESLCVVDFGIAHIGRSNSQRVTRDGEFFGTPSYMAPEYISDQAVSPALDVYQLGLIFVESLTGQVLINHPEPVATLLAHLNQNYTIPECLLESPLGPIIKRSIAPDPATRYRDAMEFAEALATIDPSTIPDTETIRAELAATVGIDDGSTDMPTMGSFGSLGDEETEVDTANVSKWVHESDGYSKTIPGIGGISVDDAPDWNSNPTPYGGVKAISSALPKDILDEEAGSVPLGIDEEAGSVPLGIGFEDTEGADDSLLSQVSGVDDTADQVEATATESAVDFTREPSAQQPPEEKEPEPKVPAAVRVSAPIARTPTDRFEQDKGSKMIPLAAGGLLLVGILLLGAAMMIDDGDSEQEKNTATASLETNTTETAPSNNATAPGDIEKNKEPETSTSAPNQTDGTAGAVGATAGEDANTEQAPEATVVEVTSNPARAKVYQGKTFMGQTPYTVTFQPKDTEPVRLSLRHKGYENLAISVGPGDGPSSKHELERVAKKEKSKKVRKGDKTPEETTPPKEEKPTVLLPK